MMHRKVIGYLFDQPGGYYKYKYYFEGTNDKIARFLICNKGQGNKITITDSFDDLILMFENEHIYVGDKATKELINVLLKYIQDMSSVEPLKFEEKDNCMIEKLEMNNK